MHPTQNFRGQTSDEIQDEKEETKNADTSQSPEKVKVRPKSPPLKLQSNMVYLNQYKKLKTVEPIKPEEFFSPVRDKEE